MIDIEEIFHNQELGEIQCSVIDFACDNCKQRFSEDSLNLAVFLYGLFYLHKTDTSYIGFTCPSCLKTILIKENRFPSTLFNRLSAFIDFEDLSLQLKLTYFTSVYHQELLCHCLPYLKRFNLSYFTASIGEDGLKHLQDSINYHVSENDLENHLCSFCDTESPPSAVEMLILYVDERYIEDMVKYEQEKNFRIIPRYIHHLHLFNQIESFCAQYAFDTPLGRLKEIAKDNLETLKFLACGNNIDVNEILSSDPSILNPESLDHLIRIQHLHSDNDYGVASNFMNILAADPYPWEVLGMDRCWIKEFWKRPYPFKDQKIPTSLVKLKAAFKADDSLKRHDEIMAEIHPAFDKGYIQKFLSDQYLGFIREYGEIAKKYAFSYADIWELKERYLEKVYKCVRSKKATRPGFNHRESCRQAAKKIWSKNPGITIADMCVRNEITHACDDIVYPEQTLRKWIKDLCPDRSPGRRPEKKKN